MVEQAETIETEEDLPDESAFPVPALVGAVVAAVIGVIVWGLIVRFTGVEIGFVAWGVGAAVGMAASMAGGKGRNLALVCALIAAGSIVGGKLLAASFLVDQERDEIVEQLTSLEVYEEQIEDAKLVQGLETDTDLKGYMIERGYADATAIGEIADEHFEGFRTETVPELNAIHADPPAYEAWVSEREGIADLIVADVSLVEVATQDLEGVDLLFLALGLISAFKIVDARGEPRRKLRRNRPRRDKSGQTPPEA